MGVRKRAARENKSPQLIDNEGDRRAWSASRRSCASERRFGGDNLGILRLGLLAVGLSAKEDLWTVRVRGAKWISGKAGGQRLTKRSATFTGDPRPFRVTR